MRSTATPSSGGGAGGTLAAVAGYPHLTVPMGQVRGLPVGLSFIGAKWDDARILSLGYAYEQASHRRVEPRFLPSIEESPEIAPHLRPHRAASVSSWLEAARSPASRASGGPALHRLGIVIDVARRAAVVHRLDACRPWR